MELICDENGNQIVYQTIITSLDRLFKLFYN